LFNCDRSRQHARHPDHPGALHYLIHAYDDPLHAQQGLKAARAYAQAAAAVPHALHVPSHIFMRLGYWDESAATNLRAWEASETLCSRRRSSAVFTKPRSMEGFLALYTRINQEDIRRNRDNIGERLGFLGRVIHGTNPRAWLQEVRERVGEKIALSAVGGLHGDNSGTTRRKE
jgi:hypothetical protein